MRRFFILMCLSFGYATAKGPRFINDFLQIAKSRSFFRTNSSFQTTKKEEESEKNGSRRVTNEYFHFFWPPFPKTIKTSRKRAAKAEGLERDCLGLSLVHHPKCILVEIKNCSALLRE